MANHVYSGPNGKAMSRSEAERKVQAIRNVNAQVGAKGWSQEIVGNDKTGYKVVEHSPKKK